MTWLTWSKGSTGSTWSKAATGPPRLRPHRDPQARPVGHPGAQSRTAHRAIADPVRSAGSDGGPAAMAGIGKWLTATDA
ncbi:hypothetical protein [Streptomyces sp. NPDC050535]|uniref:hypothetical protein n=1 Tax=Streptomyces sp. NPDC050535 TaxID=3365626 RepID=UPI003795380D